MEYIIPQFLVCGNMCLREGIIWLFLVILPTIDMFVSFSINLFDFIFLQCVFAGVIYVETGN
jgi:hypothetical protein